MTRLVNIPNADIVISELGAPEITQVTISGKGKDYKVKGGPIRGHLTILRADWHPTLVASGEWTRQRYDAQGHKLGEETGGKIRNVMDQDEMIKLLCDRIFGAGTWTFKKKPS